MDPFGAHTALGNRFAGCRGDKVQRAEAEEIGAMQRAAPASESPSRSLSEVEMRRKASTPPSDSASASNGSVDRAGVGACMSWSPSLSTSPYRGASAS
jgi:hypothetical protein